MEVLRGRGATGETRWIQNPLPERVCGFDSHRPHLAAVRSRAEFDRVLRLLQTGLNYSQISRETGISRTTIRDWDHRQSPPGAWRRNGSTGCSRCEPDAAAPIPESDYVYFLGLYLGDGCISRHHNGVFIMRVALDNRYPGIIRDCIETMASVSGRRVGLVSKIGCTEVHASWKHWPCLFPQHGAGRKHERPIVLAPWQQQLVDRRPAMLLRGLIQSDGCRVLNRVKGKDYPRYQFTTPRTTYGASSATPVTPTASAGAGRPTGPSRCPAGPTWPSSTR